MSSHRRLLLNFYKHGRCAEMLNGVMYFRYLTTLHMEPCQEPGVRRFSRLITRILHSKNTECFDQEPEAKRLP
jgi:hypothetical protein